jgi:hypothetical protein
MVACIDFFEMSEICRPKFIVRHSTSDRMTSIVDFANIIETYQYVPVTREVEINSILKFEDCNCRKRKINK